MFKEKERGGEGALQDENTEVKESWKNGFHYWAMGGYKQASLPTLCLREIIAAAAWRKHYKGKQVQVFKSRSRTIVRSLLLASRNEGW